MSLRTRGQKNFLKDELDWLDPDQELTKDRDEDDSRLRPYTFRESLSRGFRSILAVVLCIVVPVFWYFDWNPSAITNETAGFVTSIFGETPPLPAAPLPPLPELLPGNNGLDMSMVDYATALKEQGLLETFSSPAVSAFYGNGIPIDYLLRFRDAGLAADFSFPAVIAFYQNNVPFEFLAELKANRLLEELSFPAVVAFYQNAVTVDYLNRLREAQLLSDLSFPAIVAFFSNEVTIEFLTDLRERELLESLSFPDVVNLYQNS